MITLRTKFIAYLAVLHTLSGSVIGYLLWKVHPYWVFAVEGALLVSLWGALWLFQRFYEPLELLKSSADFLREKDFSTTLSTTGQPETDALIEVYNTMLLSLRQERVRTEEQGILLQTLINASPTGIMLCTEVLVVLSLNPAIKKMFELLDSDCIGKPLEPALMPLAEIILTMQHGESFLATHKGRRFKVQKTGFVERGIPHTLVLVEEVTAELRATERVAYERVIRILAHEVNNSTGAAQSLMESALHYERYFVPETPQEEREDFREALSVASERLHDLGVFMREYADVVRLPAPNIRRLNLGELLKNTAILFREACIAHHISLRVVVPEEPLVIAADAAQFQHVLTNLVKNAVEAFAHDISSLPEERVITLLARFDAKSVYIAVEDTGSGLSNHAMQSIETPFFTTKETGQGIGLMLVREILAAHEYSFTLENRVEGKGAKAEIRVPQG
jgi:nitrogen fixation/metabolism regulation signal transduction histidine kinase